MSDSMFQRLGNGKPQQPNQQPQQPDINKMFQEFQKNPLKYLPNAPKDVINPMDLLKFYADNGKVPPMLQGRVNAILGRR